MKQIPVLVYTDIGDDIDDSLAITYLSGCPDINLVGVICDHKNISYRVETAQYLLKTLDHPAPVRGSEHSDFLKDILTKYKQELVVLSIAPTTQLDKDMKEFPSLFAAIKKIVFQGQIKKDAETIIPDMQSYNFSEDQNAIQEILKCNIPMTFVGKYSAYAFPFTKDDFELLAEKKPEVWTMLYEQAQAWQTKLHILNPEMYQRLYGDHPEIMSYPYDLVTATVINHDEFFVKEIFGNKECIGQEKEKPSIKDISAFSAYVMKSLQS